MIIARFADKYDVPPARVHRSVRSLARKALARKLGIDPERRGELDLESHALDATFEQGVRVTTSRESSQFSYEVVNEEALYDWLRREHGKDLLSDGEIDRLLVYVKYLLEVMKAEGVQPEDEVHLRTSPGNRIEFNWDEAREMEHILWRADRIEERTFNSE